jgi:hypothetical protein
VRDGIRHGVVLNVLRVCVCGILEDAYVGAVIRDYDVTDDRFFAWDGVLRQNVRKEVAGVAEGDDV